MYQLNNLSSRSDARDQLTQLLKSKSKNRRLAAAYAWGRLVVLSFGTTNELKNYEIDPKGLYAVVAEVRKGTDVVIFFSASKATHSSKLRMLEVAEVIGPAQMSAARRKALQHV